MNVRIKENSNQVSIIVTGVVGTIDDTLKVKTAIVDSFHQNKQADINLYFEDSYVITSSMIGFLIKFIRGDKANLSIYPKDAQLYNLIERLNLLDILNVKKI